MQDLSQRGLRCRAALLSLQVQWQYQVRPPRLLDGMAVALEQETLRALQDPFPLYKTLRLAHATHSAAAHLRKKSLSTYCKLPIDLGSCRHRRSRLARCASLVYSLVMEGPFLGPGCWLGKRPMVGQNVPCRTTSQRIYTYRRQHRRERALRSESVQILTRRSLLPAEAPRSAWLILVHEHNT